MKVAPLHFAFKKYRSITHRIVHTGQHYDDNMSKVFFDDLELPRPDIYLGVGSGSHAVQTAKVMIEFEKIALSEKPDLVIVVGDVNSTVACALVCAKLCIPVAHVEAGLRSFDRTMPEEINRILTDSIADYLFVSERSGLANLHKEGVPRSKVFFVGNVMIDSLVRFRKKARRSTVTQALGVKRGNFVLITMHRPSNVDDRKNLTGLMQSLEEISSICPVVFPVHPRTRKMLEEYSLLAGIGANENIKLTEPAGYLDFLSLLESSALVITDSGGIQEETTYLGVPCFTMRENTERPVTVLKGTNRLMSFEFQRIAVEAKRVLGGKAKKGKIPELWDGNAGERIAKIVANSILPN